MILIKGNEKSCVGDELIYRAKKYNITLITSNYVTINQGRTTRVVYDADGYPRITGEAVGNQIRIPVDVFNELGWSVKNGN